MSSYKFQIAKIFLILLIESCFGDQNVSSLISSKDSDVDSRVAGGFRPIKDILSKYIVSIRQRVETNSTFGITHLCGGSIISPNTILTAAHCMFDSTNLTMHGPSHFKIVAKTPVRLKRTEHTEELFVKEVIVHSKYDRKFHMHDIALLILDGNINLDGQLAAKVELPTENPPAGDVCILIGWGKLYMYGPLSNNILHVDLTIQDRQYCRARFAMFTSTKICATDTDDIVRDACQGDSGGPLLCNEIVTGIVSYGYGCGGGFATVYTNVYKYLDWIARGQSNLLNSFKILNFVTLCLIVMS